MIGTFFKKSGVAVLCFFIFIIGIAVGGYLFSKTQQRTFLKVTDCQKNCFKANELAGLLASAGIQQLPNFIPHVVMQTDKTIVIDAQDAAPGGLHYLVIPKKDITSVADLSAEDDAYLGDIFKVIATIVREKKLVKYRVITNGPGYQQVTYLHFHIISEPENSSSSNALSK